jgi:hypothetical protein
VEQYAGEITSVMLRRGACFGSCPIYEVTLEADGTAVWNGERFVERLGRHRGEVDVNDLARLARFIERAGFFGWEPEYLGNVTDTPDYQLTVARRDQTKTVRQNAVDEPPDFWVIAAVVDGLAETVAWAPVDTPEGPPTEELPVNYRALPTAKSHRLVGFERAEVLTLRSYPPQYLLVVSGTKPYLNMEVELVPLVYVRQPEYWGIEVVGRLRGVGLPAVSPYTVSLALTGVLGTSGVEVIGADRSLSIDVPPDTAQSGSCRDWSADHDHQPPGAPVLRVRGTCRFPTAGYAVKLRRHEPQGINPADLLLDRIVHPPTGPAAQVVTDVEASYSEETEFEFETVTILPDGASVPVRDVH